MKQAKPSTIISNKRAYFDYELDTPITAGLVLTGPEVKSIRLNRASLKGAFVSVKDDELWLNNMQVMPMSSNAKDMKDDHKTRPRKLLITAKQLDQMREQKNNGKTIVPIKILSGRYVKVVIASGKGKKLYDKRQSLKRKDDKRSLARALKR